MSCEKTVRPLLNCPSFEEWAGMAGELWGDWSERGGGQQRKPGMKECGDGCVFFHPLHEEGGPSLEWGVCVREGSPRAGRLTFHDQSGGDCFQDGARMIDVSKHCARDCKTCD